MKKILKFSSILFVSLFQVSAFAEERGYPEIDPSKLKNQCPSELNSLLKDLDLGQSEDDLKHGITHKIALVEKGDTFTASWPAMKFDRFFDPAKKVGVDVTTHFTKEKKVSTTSLAIVYGESYPYTGADNISEAEQLLLYPKKLLIELKADCSLSWITSINNERDAQGYTRPNVYFKAEFCKNLDRLQEDPENKDKLKIKDIGWILKSEKSEAESMCKRIKVLIK